MNESLTAHIQVVGWNHREFLESCLRSCLGQTVSLPVLYVDNGSSDGSAEFVRQHFPSVRVLTNATNRGYAGGHNDGLRAMPESAVAILLNPDVILSPRFVEQLLRGFTDPRVGAVVPLLLRAGASNGEVIDAFGTRLLPTLRAVHQYEGQLISTLVHHAGVPTQPWGFSGAAVGLRRRALEDVALNGEIFDEDLFAYREDVDLSWRLRHRGWRIVGAATARATHVRSVHEGREGSPSTTRASWENYFLVLVKSVPGKVLTTHALPLLVESLGRLLQWAVTPSLWPALRELAELLPRFFRKRHDVLASRLRL